jgi:hypothetical protein
MTVNLKMMYSDMEVAIDLTNTEGYEVNNSNLLSKVEELLDHLSLYSHVSVVIKSAGEQEVKTDRLLDRYFGAPGHPAIPSIRTTTVNTTMNG